MDALVAGEPSAESPIYARLFNPTVARFERALAELEEAEEAVAFSSGMAALTAVLTAARPFGRHVVACRPLYGTSDHLLDSELLGIRTTWTSPDHIAESIRPDTSLVVIETPGNPTLRLVDIEYVVRQAAGVPVLVDSTFATPILQQPCRFGATLVLHSATKFLGGHGDVIAGVVATTDEWARRLRQVRLMTGALLHPLAAYLLHRGLPTLPLRVRRAQDTAGTLAERLTRHPDVERVLYPAHPSCDPTGLVGRQMAGAGAIFSFEIRGGLERACRVMELVELITPAVSLGSTDTLIQHPAGLTHRALTEEDRLETGITDGLLRVSVGLEDPEDLWMDLRRAIELSDVRELVRGPGARARVG
jgi:methionine-gamma-lyase